MTVRVGDVVPDFSAPSTDGDFHLSDARGSALLIYFYPKDNTPGCTSESKDFATARIPEAFAEHLASDD